MADPFEVRMRFSQQLQHLSASVTAAQKAASFALKNREMDEDLHSCILEQLERSSMNNRANIMYFIEHFCDLSQREGHPEYVHMIQRDIMRIVDAVAPLDGSGAANVRVVRRVLEALQAKQFLPDDTVAALDGVLKARDVASHPFVDAEQEGEGAHGVGSGVVRHNGGGRLEKRQIEQRIEEDRERHKRQRETIWAVSAEPGGEAELMKMLDEASDLDEDDYLAGAEEAEEKKIALEFGVGA